MGLWRLSSSSNPSPLASTHSKTSAIIFIDVIELNTDSKRSGQQTHQGGTNWANCWVFGAFDWFFGPNLHIQRTSKLRKIRLISTYIRPFTWHACHYLEATRWLIRRITHAISLLYKLYWDRMVEDWSCSKNLFCCCYSVLKHSLRDWASVQFCHCNQTNQIITAKKNF